MGSQEIEIVAYALLVHLKIDFKQTKKDMLKFLTSQQNSHGGFKSTQDTIIALQALTEHEKTRNRGKIDLNINISNGVRTDFEKVTNDNIFELQPRSLAKGP